MDQVTTPGRPGMARTAVAFRVGLGLVFVCAFGSLLPQVPGLIGVQGISPAGEYLQHARAALGARAFFEVPTIFWLGASDGALQAGCVMGILCGLLLAAGVAPKALVMILWALYLSVVGVGGVFLGYQWDALLLETAFFSFFLLPGALFSPGPDREPPWAGVVGLRVLLLKLMFLSGLVKLVSGDDLWLHLDALRYHYWTQPLPAWPAWYADKLPGLFQKLSVLVMFGVELWAPWFLFLPMPKVRRVAAFLLIALQLAIALTGTYGFFNLLTLVLCLAALDDGCLPRFALPRPPMAQRPPARSWDRTISFAVFFFLALSLVEPAAYSRPFQHAVRPVLRILRPFATFNSYGLFARMTTERREISVQGSDDGLAWREYRFRYKPAALAERPRYATPGMPRLDWQMWFASLESCRENPWFLQFQWRLLQGAPPVLSLLAADPFPGHPPRYLRTPSWQYRFSDSGPDWWRRTPDEDYCPPLTLGSDGALQRAEF